MLQNLLFSLNMSLPLFVLLGLGCLLTHKGMFTEDYIARTTNLVYYVMLPAKLYRLEGRDYARPEADAVREAAAALGVGVPALRMSRPDEY